MRHVELRHGAYADSVALLQVSRDVQALEGVTAAQVAMATALNLEVLAGMGFDVPPSTPNDMVVALDLDESALDSALAAIASALTPPVRTDAERVVAARSTRSALRRGGDLVLVSVPGASATVEAMDALESGVDVMVFSDNVPLAEEIALKQAAVRRGLLVMGPDCGTAVVDGVGLGFANVVRPGPVGIVAASGTGCQQLMCLLDAAGVGVAAALGVGGRDLSAEVSGLSTVEAMRRLDADPSVELIVVVSKPPAKQVAHEIAAYADSFATPVRLALLGPGQPDLSAAAEAALRALGRGEPAWPKWGRATPAAGGRYLRGLFVGGTLCEEAMLIAREHVGEVQHDLGFLAGPAHTMVDFGDDSLTQGRAHPMIDPTLRLEHLAKVGADPTTGVVLLDVVLGHGAEPDPAGGLAPVIQAIDKPVVVACVGTNSDPQGLQAQASALAAAGAEVHLSNAHATRRALELLA